MTKLFTRKGLVLLVVLIFAVIALAGCSSTTTSEQPAEQPQMQQISFATSSPGGVFYPLAVAMCDIINKNVPDARALTEQTGGSVENMNLLTTKKAEIGFATDSTGLETYDPAAYVYGWKIMDDTLQFIALKESGLTNINQLQGKRVVIGAAGSSANVQSGKLLAAAGVTDFEPLYLDYEKAADALVDKMADAVVVMGAYPTPAIQGTQARADVVLLDVNPEVITDNFQMPINLTVIPAGTYKDQATDINVFGASAGAWIRADLSEDMVYAIVKAVFENTDYLGQVHRAGKDQHMMSQQEAEAMGVEVHPGVIKYATEMGVW